MSPVLKYTLARVGLFVVAAAIALSLPIGLNVFLRLGIALVVSATLSWFLLKGLRDDVANHLAEVVKGRAARRERLRSALAGDDEPPSSTPV